MAWSWVRVSTKTSPKLERCLDGDTSSARARGCITEIVTAAGGAFQHNGETGDLRFENNGRWARVKFWWNTPEIKRDVVYDLQAEDVVDLVEDDERDELRGRDG